MTTNMSNSTTAMDDHLARWCKILDDLDLELAAIQSRFSRAGYLIPPLDLVRAARASTKKGRAEVDRTRGLIRAGVLPPWVDPPNDAA